MIKRILFNFITKHLFKMITDKDFVRVDPKTRTVFIGNRPLNKSQIETLVKSAQDLKSNDAFILITREMFDAGEKKIYHEAVDTAGIDRGKMVLWTLDLIIKKADNLSKLK